MAYTPWDSSTDYSWAQQPCSLQRTAGGDRPGGQSHCPGLWETQILFSLPVEFKDTFPQKCSNFYLEASLGYSVNNLMVLCKLEQAQACVLQSIQGCLGFQGKQTNNVTPARAVCLAGLHSDAHRNLVPFRMSLSILSGCQIPLQAS